MTTALARRSRALARQRPAPCRARGLPAGGPCVSRAPQRVTSQWASLRTRPVGRQGRAPRFAPPRGAALVCVVVRALLGAVAIVRRWRVAWRQAASVVVRARQRAGLQRRASQRRRVREPWSSLLRTGAVPVAKPPQQRPARIERPGGIAYNKTSRCMI